MAPFLTMTGITKRFPGVTANEGIDLRVDRGEIHGLLGENGAGKTTLVNILYGLLQPDEGSIEVDGRPVRLRSPRASMALGIGMVHQHFMLVPDMTVAENVALGLRSSRPPLARLGEVSAHLAELSDRYGLRVAPDQRIEDLTVAMQQRVEILKLLYRGAQLLILDEPTAVLTPRGMGRARGDAAVAGRRGPLGDLHHAQAGRAPRCRQPLHRAARRACRRHHRGSRRPPTRPRWPG